MLGKLKKVRNAVAVYRVVTLAQGMGELKANTEIEADYLMAKSKNNFDHPSNILNAIKVSSHSFHDMRVNDRVGIPRYV